LYSIEHIYVNMEYVGNIQGALCKNSIDPQEICVLDLNSDRQFHVFLKLKTTSADPGFVRYLTKNVHGIPHRYGQDDLGDSLLKFCGDEFICLYVKGVQQVNAFKRLLLPSVVVTDWDRPVLGPELLDEKCYFHREKLDRFMCAREKCHRLKKMIMAERNVES
jgi:hypothetical protein